jgi:hypothetical protein
MRTSRILLATFLASPLALAVAPTTTATAVTTTAWCDATTPTPPCITSATIGSIDIESDPDWDFLLTEHTSDGSRFVDVNLLHNGDNELGPAALTEQVVVHVLTGDLTPRVVSGKAKNTSVGRAGSGTAQEVTVTGKPVVVSGVCDQSPWPWTCTEFKDLPGTFTDP